MGSSDKRTTQASATTRTEVPKAIDAYRDQQVKSSNADQYVVLL
jgi:hypothetical protein